MNYRMLAVAPGFATPLLVNDRTYSRVAGSIHNAPYLDRAAMIANGFTELYRSGTTSERPDHRDNTEHKPNLGSLYFDTTLSTMLASDGTAWRDMMTGELI